jgi:hypothetical protein
MLNGLVGDCICANRSHAQGYHADRATYRHRGEDVALPCIVLGAASVEMHLDDLSFLASIMNGRRSQTDSDGTDTESKGHGNARDRSGRGGPRYQSRIVLPFFLKLFGCHGRAFDVELLEIKRHDCGRSASVGFETGNNRRSVKIRV